MSIFGSLIEPGDIEDATIATIRLWLETYLAEIERQKDLQIKTIARPTTPESIYGGLDFYSYEQRLMPSIVVVVKPAGEPERYGSAGYGQMYEVQVGALVIDDDEDKSRRTAGLYGGALMGVMLQGNYAEDFIQDVVMTLAPENSFIDEDERRITLNTATYLVFAMPIIDPGSGPLEPDPTDPDAPAPDWPTVQTTSLDVEAEPVDY